MEDHEKLPSRHLALILDKVGAPMKVESQPTPQSSPGSVVIRVLAGCILSYAGKRYSSYDANLDTPLTVGFSCVGRVARIGGDSTRFKPGNLVFVDPFVHARDGNDTYILQGHFHPDTDGSGILSKGEWRDGVFAEYAKVPLENVTLLNEARLLGSPSEGGLGYSLLDLVYLNEMLIAYGGLDDVHVSTGDTVVIAPATGSIGKAAVHVALAMGANVIALGRNERKLEDLMHMDHRGRLSTLKLSENMQTDLSAIKRIACGSVDVYFDISPSEASSATYVKSCILSVRPGGRISLMGTFSQDIAIPLDHIMFSNITLQGTRMYTRDQREKLIRLVHKGMLRLGSGAALKPALSYSLHDWREAFESARKNQGRQAVAFYP